MTNYQLYLVTNTYLYVYTFISLLLEEEYLLGMVMRRVYDEFVEIQNLLR